MHLFLIHMYLVLVKLLSILSIYQLPFRSTAQHSPDLFLKVFLSFVHIKWTMNKSQHILIENT